MDDITFEVLSWLAVGNTVFRPREHTPKGQEEFHAVALLLEKLRTDRLVTFLDGHIARTEAGTYLMIGPVHLTPAGIAALERDARSGERLPWSHGELPWRL